MMRSRRTWWVVFTACATAVMAAMAWITTEMIRLEASESKAWSEATHQESLNLALWRMDSWFVPHLAREAARPYSDYRSFYPQQAYTRQQSRLDPNEVLVPSPLLTFDSAFVRLHFQIDPNGSITSPQVPTGSVRTLAIDRYLTEMRLATNRTELQRLTGVIAPVELAQCVAVNEPVVPSESMAMLDAPPDASKDPASRTRGAPLLQEFNRRQAVYWGNACGPEQLDMAAGNAWGNETGQAPVGDVPYAIPASATVPDPARDDASWKRGDVNVGPLVPMWTDRPGGQDLMFVRRAQVGPDEYLQGFVCDWPALAATLLEQAADLLPLATLAPVSADRPGAGPPQMLATIPARLVATPVATAADVQRPTRSILFVSWFAVLVGLVAVAATLQASIAAAERRSRFASAVTHELRTPLTTFRMYSEMLADGIVQDESQRQVYLDTLKSESGRLAALVENVLAYARIERGQTPVERCSISVRSLIERAVPTLRECAERADMTLVIDPAIPDLQVNLDPEAVVQILQNLVENACKYARDAPDRSIDVRAEVREGLLSIQVRDHGPGIEPEHERAVFLPFERGARHTGDSTPGVGLGLALARSLARGQGGDLRVCRMDGGEAGACLRLTLPIS